MATKQDNFTAVLSAGLVGRDLVTAQAASEPGFDLAAAALGAIDAQAAEIATLKRSISAQKGQVTRERKRAEALEAELPPKPRKFGAIDTPLTAGELSELIGDAESVQIAFLDPKGVEVAGLAPRMVEGGRDAWQARSRRLFLDVPSLLVHGPSPEAKTTRELAGYALLINGEHVATCARDMLRIGAGQQVELKGDVVFG